MLTVTAEASDPREVEADVLVLPAFKGGIDGPGVQLVLGALGLDRLPVTPDFRGDVDQTLLLAAPGIAAGAVLIVGVGRMDEVAPARLRHAAGTATRAARGLGARLATTLPQLELDDASLEAVAEGLALGAYADRRQRTTPDDAPPAEEAVLLVPSSRLGAAESAITHAAVTARAVAVARDLVNSPPSEKRPPDLADTIRALAAGRCEVEVHDEAWLAEHGCGGLLAVGRGSSAPPRLVRLHHRPADPLAHVVLVGKGITFDSGGLSLKRDNAHLADMKSDMAGAAVVAAVCTALAELDVRLEVTGLCALAENMLDGDAQRPGDVLVAYDGQTVEVHNTDGEGRLVLADALGIGKELEPDAMVDVATLTGGQIAAVGHLAAAVMGDDEVVGELRRAAETAGEDLWPLPLWPWMERLVDSDVADVGQGDHSLGGSSSIAGHFLRRFTGEVPWAHLDVAGPSFLRPEMARGYATPGGTGYGVRTLLAWLERRA